MRDLFELYKKYNDKKIDELVLRLDRIDSKLDSLAAFKWKVIGTTLGAGVVLQALFVLVLKILDH